MRHALGKQSGRDVVAVGPGMNTVVVYHGPQHLRLRRALGSLLKNQRAVSTFGASQEVGSEASFGNGLAPFPSYTFQKKT